MDSIYLSRVDIQNFRVYGEHFSLELPPGPGLTLVSGCNGLGKTTFFEAIEWALTGKVIRIKPDLKGKPLLTQLVRRDMFKQAASCRVELDFGGVGGVARQGVDGGADDGQVSLTGLDGTGSSGEVSELLRSPGWGRTIHDVGTYLALTHFLTQSERPRFFRLESAEMWGALAGPTGAAHLETLRKQLDRTTGNAFKRAKEAAAAALEQARKTLADWQDRGRKLDALRQAAAAGAGIAPEGVLLELAEIWRQLGRERPDGFSGNEPDRALADTAVAIARFERAATAQGELAAGSAALARVWLEAGDSMAVAHSEMKTIEEQSTAEQRTLETLRASADAAATRRVQLAREQQLSIHRLEELTRLLRALDGDEAELAGQTEIDAELARIEVESTTQQTARADAAALVARHDDLQLRRTQLGTEAETWRTLRSRLEACLAAESSLASQQGGHDATARRRDTAAATLRAAEQTERQSTEELAAAEEALAAARATLGEINSAVARLASLLGEHDAECPLCATGFATPGTLRQRANTCATRIDRSLAPLLERATTARQTVETSRGALATARRESSAAEQLAAANSVAREQVFAMRSAIDADARLFQRDRATQMQFLDDSINQTTEALDRLGAEQAALPGHEAARRNLAVAERARADSEEKRVRLIKDRQESQERRSLWALQRAAGDALLRESGGTSANVRTSAARLQIELDEREAALQAADREASETATRVTREQVTVAATQARLTAAAESVARFAQSQKNADERWKANNHLGQPNEAAAQSLRLKAVEQLALHQRLVQRHAAVVRGWTLWRSHQALHDAEAAHRREYTESGTPESHTAALLRQVQAATDRNRRVEQSFTLSKRLAENLRNQQQKYTDDVLEPFGERVSAFERMISPFQNQVIFQTRHRSDTITHSNVNVKVPRLASDMADEYEMHTRLSEGQVSALGVSMIFGASTAYHWSRWRALLLDDPLQHTDLIHASAFIDVLRALIIKRGYQVVISSHDLEESEFIVRKCRRFRIPLQHCLLTGTGKEGVRARVSSDF